MCDSIFPDLTTYCCIVFVCLTIHALRLSVLLLTPSLACTLANIHSLEWCFFAIPVRCLLKSVRVIFLGVELLAGRVCKFPTRYCQMPLKVGILNFNSLPFVPHFHQPLVFTDLTVTSLVSAIGQLLRKQRVMRLSLCWCFHFSQMSLKACCYFGELRASKVVLSPGFPTAFVLSRKG